MTTLADFLEPITVAGKPLAEGCKGYRMDGTSPRPDMRKTVGLGTCNCCDYLAIKDDTVVLIEETQLMEMVKNLKSEYQYLSEDDKNKFVDKCILQENKLKVYGSMLVLCRLDAVYNDAKILRKKRYDFWLVVSDQYKKKNSRLFSNLKNRLLGYLRSSLGKMMIAVEVIPADELAAKLAANASTP